MGMRQSAHPFFLYYVDDFTEKALSLPLIIIV